MAENEVKDRILIVLKKHPEGLTIIQIAKEVGMHRHSIVKYIYELTGEKKIIQRKIGPATLCYIYKKKFEKSFASVAILIIIMFMIPSAHAFKVLYKATGSDNNLAWNFTSHKKPANETPLNAPSAGLFSASNYTLIATSDDNRMFGGRTPNTTEADGGNDYEVMMYQVNVTQDITTITSINITWEGYSNLNFLVNGTDIYLYNFSSGAWNMVVGSNSKGKINADNVIIANISQAIVSSFLNASNNSLLWIQVESRGAGSPHIYAFNGTDHIFIVDAVPFSFMRSLEGTTYAEIKKEYLPKINGKYVLRITDPFPNEEAFINDVRLYGIRSSAGKRFLPSMDGTIHSIEKLENPSKQEGNKFYFSNPDKKKAKIVVEARMTNNPVQAVRYLFSKLGGNNYDFYNSLLSLPFINLLWSKEVTKQAGIQVYANGKLVDILELKGNTMHDAGFGNAVFPSDYEERIVYADIEDRELDVELKYPGTFYMIRNVYVDYSDDTDLELKELKSGFAPFVTKRGNYTDIYFDADDDYDSFIVSLKGWYRPDWALGRSVNFFDSLKYFYNEVLPAIFGKFNFILKNIENFHNTMYNDYFAVNITYDMPIEFVGPTDVDGANVTRNHTYINVTNNTGISSMFIDFNYSLIGYWNFNNNTL